jgi:hypothetical protein
VRILAIAVVVLIGAAFAYAAPPLGYILHLQTAEILIATVAGAVLGAYVLVFASDWIFGKLLSGFYRMLGKPVPQRTPAPQWMLDFVDRFGAPGLGLIGPATIGGLAAAFLVPVLGIPKGKGAFWLAVGSAVTFGGYALLVIYAVRVS